jgi:hypothetical protein
MKRLLIDRLELDLRGIPHATAEAAARRIGPALSGALADRRLTAATTASIDAGAVVFGAAPDADALATRIAQQIAGKTSRSRS